MEGTGYPPQQGYYPPPQVQTAFPPQQQYPPQQGYPPPHEEDKNVPPPYYPPPLQQPYPTIDTKAVPATQQQSTTNVVVVQSQPTPVITKTVVRRLSGDHYLTLSIVLTFLCFFLGTWYSLFCTIPAIILAISARDAESRGDVEGAQRKARVALILNIVSIVWWAIAIVIIIIAASAAAATGSDAGSYYSSYCQYYTRYRSRYYYNYTYSYRYYYYSTYSGYRCYK